MTTIQHIIFALFAGIPIFWQMCFAVDFTLNWMNPGWFIIAFTVGTFLPDIEFMGSYIWEILKSWSVMLQAEGADGAFHNRRCHGGNLLAVCSALVRVVFRRNRAEGHKGAFPPEYHSTLFPEAESPHCGVQKEEKEETERSQSEKMSVLWKARLSAQRWAGRNL